MLGVVVHRRPHGQHPGTGIGVAGHPADEACRTQDALIGDQPPGLDITREDVGAQMLGIPMTGDRFDLPFTAVITFRDGMMEGEHVYYDLDLFCQQAGVDADAIRAAASALQAPAPA